LEAQFLAYVDTYHRRRSQREEQVRTIIVPRSQARRYVATALSDDEEMRARIAKHQDSRPAAWATVEEPLAVAEAAERHIRETDVILIDCLTIWLSNLLYEWRDGRSDRSRAQSAGSGRATH